MATIEELEEAGNLVRIEIELDDNEQPWRCLYGTPDFIRWLDEVLPDLQTTILGCEITPLEQLDALFHSYVVGVPLSTDRRFKPLNWTPDLHVWELKTLDLRVFGWVPQRDHLICAFGEQKDQLELLNGYGRFIALTNFEREQMPLNEPKSITEKGYDDVLSDAY